MLISYLRPMVSVCRRPWTPATTQASQVRCLRCSHSLGETQRVFRCPLLCENCDISVPVPKRWDTITVERAYAAQGPASARVTGGFICHPQACVYRLQRSLCDLRRPYTVVKLHTTALVIIACSPVPQTLLTPNAGLLRGTPE